jgi:hypothetical protein
MSSVVIKTYSWKDTENVNYKGMENYRQCVITDEDGDDHPTLFYTDPVTKEKIKKLEDILGNEIPRDIRNIFDFSDGIYIDSSGWVEPIIASTSEIVSYLDGSHFANKISFLSLGIPMQSKEVILPLAFRNDDVHWTFYKYNSEGFGGLYGFSEEENLCEPFPISFQEFLEHEMMPILMKYVITKERSDDCRTTRNGSGK